MAALQAIRSKGPLLVGVVGLALFAFIAGDAWKVMQPHTAQNVGSINGTSLSAQDYQTMVETYTEAYKTAQGTTNLTEAENNQIKDQVWQTYLYGQLIGEQADKLGIEVTTEEIQYLLDEGTHNVLMNSPFVNTATGAFDKDMMNMFLANYASMNATNVSSDVLQYYQQIFNFWSFLQDNLELTRRNEKYQYMITKSLMSNSIEAQDRFNSRVEQVDMLMAAVPYSALQDDNYQITSSDLNAYYNKHKEEFKQEVESRDIRYIDLQVTASQEDRDALDQEMADVAEQLRGEVSDYATLVRQAGSDVSYVDLYYTADGFPVDVYSRLDSAQVGQVYGPYYYEGDNTVNVFRKVAQTVLPDSVQFRQIQVSAETQARTAELADSIYNAIKGGADFAAVAQIYGQSGEAQWVSSANYQGASLDGDNTKYINAIATSSKNQLVSLPLTQATIIMEVTDQKASTPKYKVAVVKREIEFSKETYNKAYNDFSEFVAENNTLEKMIANAEDAGYRLYSATDVLSTDHYVGSISGTHDALKWAFDAKKGEVSSLYECGESDRMMMVGVENIHEAGYRSAQEIQDQVYTTIVNEKKAEKIAADMLAAGSFEAAGNIEGAVTDTLKRVTFSSAAFIAKTIASEPKVSAWATVGKQGQTSAPVKGTSGVYMLKTLSSSQADTTYDEISEMASLVSNYKTIVANQFIVDLENKAKIEDKRYLYF